jgi:hypothetical protein
MPTDVSDDALQFVRERIKYYSMLEESENVTLLPAKRMMRALSQYDRLTCIEPVMVAHQCSEVVALATLMDIYDRYPDL